MGSLSFYPLQSLCVIPPFQFLQHAYEEVFRLPVPKILFCGQVPVRIVNNPLNCGPPPK